MKRTWFCNFAAKYNWLLCSRTNTFLLNLPLFWTGLSLTTTFASMMVIATWSTSPVGTNCLQWCSANWVIVRVFVIWLLLSKHIEVSNTIWGWGHNPIAKATLSYANQYRDYRIFEEFAFYMMKEACEKRATNILDIPGKKYAFDSTTIPLCLATFPWEKFRRKKGGVKAHVLYYIEAQVPAFYTVTTASKHDSTAMSSIFCEPNAYYVFDRAYDSFKELYRIHLTESFM